MIKRNKKKKEKKKKRCTQPNFIKAVLVINLLIAEWSSVNCVLFLGLGQCINLYPLLSILQFNNSCSSQLNNVFSKITKIVFRYYSTNQLAVITVLC